MESNHRGTGIEVIAVTGKNMDKPEERCKKKILLFKILQWDHLLSWCAIKYFANQYYYISEIFSVKALLMIYDYKSLFSVYKSKKIKLFIFHLTGHFS